MVTMLSMETIREINSRLVNEVKEPMELKDWQWEIILQNETDEEYED